MLRGRGVAMGHGGTGAESVWLWVGRNEGYVGKLSRRCGNGMGVVTWGGVNVSFVAVRNRRKYTTKSLRQTVPYHPCNSSDGALRAFAI